MEQTDLSFYPLVIVKLVLFSYRSHPFRIIIMFFTGSISTAEGSALVKLANTTVVCGVKAVSHQHIVIYKTCVLRLISFVRLGIRSDLLTWC